MTVRSRAQSLYETALFLPFFLVAFYGLIWGIKTTVAAERAQVGVRDAGLALAHGDPYRSYSLYNVYNNLGKTLDVTPAGCSSPSPGAVTDFSTVTNTSSPGFFRPDLAPVVSCDAAGALAVMSAGRGGFSGAQQAYVFTRNAATIDFGLTVPRAVISALGTRTDTHATSNFLVEADLGNLLRCFPELRTAIGKSLDITKDASADRLTPPLSAAAMATYTVPPVPAPACARQLRAPLPTSF